MKAIGYRLSIILAAYGACTFDAASQLQAWTLTNGEVVEGELVNFFGDNVSLKTREGRTLQIPFLRFTEEDRTRLELENPPKLDISLTSVSEKKNFPAGPRPETQRPPEQRVHYGVTVKQTSTGSYHHELTLDMFIIGQERLGDRFLLLDHQQAPFRLDAQNRRIFDFRSNREVGLKNFTISGFTRGEKYFGYLAIVTDARGKIVAAGYSHEWLWNNVEELKMRGIGNFMDESCKRVFPTRPKPFF